MTTNQRERAARWSFPVSALTLSLVMIYAFSREMQALNWGIIAHVMDDFAFSWIKFAADPGPQVPKLLSHTFLHANAAHITGNLVFFALFAPAVERVTGHVSFVALYLLWGAAAAVTQGFFEPYSEGLIGASGAISGAAGAYFVLFPLKTPSSLLMRPFGRFASQIPAFFWIGLWLVAQIKGGFRALVPDLTAAERVAYWAHLGGFAAGALTMAPFVGLRAKKESE